MDQPDNEKLRRSTVLGGSHTSTDFSSGKPARFSLEDLSMGPEGFLEVREWAGGSTVKRAQSLLHNESCPGRKDFARALSQLGEEDSSPLYPIPPSNPLPDPITPFPSNLDFQFQQRGKKNGQQGSLCLENRLERREGSWQQEEVGWELCTGEALVRSGPEAQAHEQTEAE